MILDSDIYFGQGGFPIAVCREGTFRSMGIWPNYTETEHSHNFLELVFILEGQGMHCLEGQSFPVSAGDVFLLQGRQKHFFHDLRNIELVNVLYDPDRLGLPESELRKLPGYCAMFMLEPKHRRHHHFSSRLHLQRRDLVSALQILDKIDCAFTAHDAGWEITALTSLQELIIYLSKCYTNSDSPDATALLRVADVISLLEKEFMKPWTLDDLVNTANMSRGNLIRIFRNATGQTPIEYLIDIRLQRAINMLKNSELPITEIAYLVGFNDSNYFSRLFREKLNASPREYRMKYL